MEAAEQSLRNPGTASAQVPIVAEMPIEMIQQWKDSHMDLATQFDSTIVDLRDNGIERLAATLDMPKSIAQGTQGESNHWSAWQVRRTRTRSTWSRCSSASATRSPSTGSSQSLKPWACKTPRRYVIDWDISEIVARPDSQEDINWLYDHDLISDDARRAASGIPDDAIPSAQELETRRAWKVVQADPTYAAQPDYAQVLGLPAAEPTAPTQPPAPEVQPADQPAELPAATPDTQDAAQSNDVALAAAASFVVLNALSRAGKRLLTNQNRGQFKSTQPQDLYLSIDYDAADVPKMLDGSFENLDGLAETFGYDPRAFENLLRGYVENRLMHKAPHDRDVMKRFLR